MQQFAHAVAGVGMGLAGRRQTYNGHPQTTATRLVASAVAGVVVRDMGVQAPHSAVNGLRHSVAGMRRVLEADMIRHDETVIRSLLAAAAELHEAAYDAWEAGDDTRGDELARQAQAYSDAAFGA